MKKIRNIRFRALTLAFACIIGTSACSSAQTDVSSEVLSTESSSQTENTLSDANSSNSADSTTIYGKVTAVNGNEITFEVGTLNAADALSGATANAQPAGHSLDGY
jgi:type IV secretory pathway TrbL component